MNAYVYSPLHDEHSIRLVQILPGDSWTPISVTVVHAHLRDEVQYECLSYAWGKPDLARSVTVVPATPAAEPSSPSSLAVSTNLFEALLHLRDTERPRLFWIDAICIDQGNILERGRQVGIMRRIYSAAERVVVWLGSATPTSGQALRFLDEMAQSMKDILENSWYKREVPGLDWQDTPMRSQWEDWQTGRCHPGGEEHISYGFPVLYETPLWDFFAETRNPDWAALDELLARPWWSRAWVVQEVWCARSHDAVLLQCGADHLNWGQVRLALNYRESWDDMGNAIRSECNTVRSQLWPSLKRQYGRAIHIAGERVKGSPLSSLLWNTWDRDAMDPRDKVYAMLYLAGDGGSGGYGKHQVSILPDYTKPVEQVYIEVACEIMKRSKNLDYVLLAASNRNDDRNLPSWVPDWRREANDVRPGLFVNRQKLYSMYHSGSMEQVVTWGHGYLAAGDSTPSVEFDSSLQTLAVPAFEFDTVLDCAEAFLPSREAIADDVKDYVDVAVQMAQRLGMLGDEMGTADVEIVLAAGAPIQPTTSFTEIMASVLPHRRFFVTQGHRLALGPALAKKGDALAIIAGCNYPLVLHKYDDGKYRLVGESFVQGVMEGQLLGFRREAGSAHNDEVRAEDSREPKPSELESETPLEWKMLEIR